MKIKWWIVTIIIAALVIFLFQKESEQVLTTPNSETNLKQTVEQPTPTPAVPKQYNFDSSTDLKKELESINPKILDSDFE